VRWVFDPTTDTYQETTPVSAIWPGSSYVDVLGLDGYNWGTGGIFTWRSFAAIYGTQYQRLTALASGLPVWICEVGSKEPTQNDGAPVDPNHSKTAWFQGLFSTVGKTMTRVQAVVLFDVTKERNWRIDATAATRTYIAGIAATAAPTLTRARRR
jgi:beta-mannanase